MSSIVAESKESSHPRPHVIDIQLRKENLEKYTFLTEIVIISDYDSSSRRLVFTA